LVVAIDSDTGDINRRLRQFQIALDQERLAPRSNDEAVVHLVPRRSIETWILCLNGTSVDEETDYRHEDLDERISTAAATLYDWSRPNAQTPAHRVPSLRTEIPEIRRLK
jgi:hypothetical protein